MIRDGNDWIPPLDQHDLLMIQPDLQSSGFPVAHPANKPMFQRPRRRVRFATQLTVEAYIPENYWEPIKPAKPPKLTFRELRERVQMLTREVCDERFSVTKEREVLYNFKQEYESLKYSREHTSRLKRAAIHELQLECDKLEHNILQMKSDIQIVKEQSMVGQQRKRRLSQRELYSDACTKARVPTIWGRARLERLRSYELLPCA